MRTNMKFMLVFTAFCLFLACPLAASAASLLTTGSDGAYWGLSKAEIQAKSPGTFAGEESRMGFVLLSFTGMEDGFPVSIFYTLKNDKCWKITIETDPGDKETILPRFETALAEVTAILGEPTERAGLEDVSSRIYWKEGETTGSVEWGKAPGDTDRVAMHVGYESAALTKAIWGKLGG